MSFLSRLLARQEALRGEIQELEKRIAHLLQSKSWRVTAPLRKIHSLLHGFDDQTYRAPNPAKTLNEYTQTLLNFPAELAFQNFLASGMRLRFELRSSEPVTAIIILHNRVELSLRCLTSLAAGQTRLSEIIVIDNASTDQTKDLLDRIEGCTIIRNSENVHFLKAANQAAGCAKSEFLLFLNSDAEVLPGSIESALETICLDPKIGAVGGKLILPDGRLQEAGGILWQNGICKGYGRGEDPMSGAYNFRRDVAYNSGAFLLTRRELFEKVGGFDPAYEPAYCEDVDYCIKLWRIGFRVVYEPGAVVLHHEHASSSQQAAVDLMHANRQTFLSKHDLREFLPEDDTDPLLSRSMSKPQHRVLLMEEGIPHRYVGAGYPRANAILNSLLRLGCFVTLYPTRFQEEWHTIYEDTPREVEVMRGYGTDGLPSFFEERKNYYDIIIVCRSRNIDAFERIRKEHPEWFSAAKIVYDWEAITALREIEQRRLKGEPVSAEEAGKMLRRELEPAASADFVIAVTENERKMLEDHGAKRTLILGHSMAAAPTIFSFHERSGFLFVGPIHDEISPNADSVLWFRREIFPCIQKMLKSDPTFTIVGLNNSAQIASMNGSGITHAGMQEDVSPYYNHARVFVAPTRFSAGLPYKVAEAAAYGVPIVATSLLAKQLNWENEVELLVADDAESFARQCGRLYEDPNLWNEIRNRALERVRLDYSPEKFETELRKILGI